MTHQAKRMDVLIACEESGTVGDAFTRKGHNVLTADLQPSRSTITPHHQGDVRPLLRKPWDLVIAHPECTFLTNAGAKHLYQGKRRWNPDGTENPYDLERIRNCTDAAEFFLECLNANAPRVCVENPIMHDLARKLTMSADDRQTVQPWWFGEKMFKGTTLRLRGLPKLVATNKLTPPKPGTQEHKDWSWVFRCPPGPDRAKIRSKTAQGIADAMAEQWGDMERMEAENG